MNLPRCPLTLTSAVSDWRGWAHTLSDAELVNAKAAVVQYRLRAPGTQVAPLAHIEALMREEMAGRFAGLLARWEEAQDMLRDVQELAALRKQRLNLYERQALNAA